MHDPSNHGPRESLESFRCGDAGIEFTTLCRFAKPIFDLFECDLSASSDALTDEQADDHVAALETSRLFWAFFESGGQDEAAKTFRLQSVLFGPEASLEEQAAMAALLERLAENWQSLPVKLRRPTSHRPSFETLVAMLEGKAAEDTPAGPPHSVNGQAHGAMPVDSPEALAAFASPLLDDPSIDDNPDVLSEMMVRAQAYWRLATLTGDTYAEELERLADTYASTEDEKSAIAAEANMMVARFHRLFPHWS